VGPGRYLAVASAEWQRPILVGGLSSDWESTVFVDAGNVADRAGTLGRDMAVGVGAGARWKSPVGPLQIDLAYGVKVQQLRLHLSVGFVF
jgi:translocation and assembly module TamA